MFNNYTQVKVGLFLMNYEFVITLAHDVTPVSVGDIIPLTVSVHETNYRSYRIIKLPFMVHSFRY